MNIQECDILRTLAQEPGSSQRQVAETTGHSLGVVNRSLKNLQQEGFLQAGGTLSEMGEALLAQRAPRNAVILAAGFGMRMVPINTLTPKGLLEVKGEALIERQIRQLREAGVREIAVVVGFMMEQFDYLVEEYGVELILNPQYARRNNLYSLYLARERLGNTYIVPCDLYCEENPFRQQELYSWYMVSDRTDPASEVRVNRRLELVRTAPEEKRKAAAGGARAESAPAGNAMIGIAYLLQEDGAALRTRLTEMVRESRYDDAFWEAALYRDGRMTVPARVVPAGMVEEINTYEQLRELDAQSNHLKSDALEIIAEVLHAGKDEIHDITVLKKGMTNRSFLFSVRGEKYIMRIPGEGTDRLINRRQEAEVYRAISGRGLCDNPVYINPDNGYKITKFLSGIRNADPENERDLERCMRRLRSFHEMNLQVEHSFDVFGQMEFYETLWEGKPSVYRDYRKTKERVLSLKPWIEAQDRQRTLTHIDAVPDNFLFYTEDGQEKLQLTDWEYAGMQDPYVDIAMFCIYSLYDRKQTDRLIDCYFEGQCEEGVRTRIYCYIAACGLLWSNWCEYKRNLGVEFGEYSLRQYRYAKDYWKIAAERIGGQTL